MTKRKSTLGVQTESAERILTVKGNILSYILQQKNLIVKGGFI